MPRGVDGGGKRRLKKGLLDSSSRPPLLVGRLVCPASSQSLCSSCELCWLERGVPGFLGPSESEGCSFGSILRR
jgi:hypothetical protein